MADPEQDRKQGDTPSPLVSADPAPSLNDISAPSDPIVDRPSGLPLPRELQKGVKNAPDAHAEVTKTTVRQVEGVLCNKCGKLIFRDSVIFVSKNEEAICTSCYQSINP